MRGRLTVDKVNAAVCDMATYAEANAQLIGIPKKKVSVKFSHLKSILITTISLISYMLTMTTFSKAGREPLGKGPGKFTNNFFPHLFLFASSFLLRFCIDACKTYCRHVGSRQTCY